MLTKEKVRNLLMVIHENNIKGVGVNRHTVIPIKESEYQFVIDGSVMDIDSAILKILERR